jgi:hypothetical protein
MTLNNALNEMLAELETYRLEVVLVPCRRFVNEGGMIRVAAGKNAKWYSEFCYDHSSSRARVHRLHDTKIKRRNVLRLLNRLILTGESRSKYAGEIRGIAMRRVNQSRGVLVRGTG